jgi:hypothetical protein
MSVRQSRIDSDAKGGTQMNRLVGLFGVTMLALGMWPESAVSQPKPLQERLLGTWTLLSHETVRPDGSTFL